MCLFTQNVDSFFFWELCPFELRYSAKINYVTKTGCQRNSPETPRQNLVKFCAYEDHTVYMCIFTGKSDLIVF